MSVFAVKYILYFKRPQPKQLQRKSPPTKQNTKPIKIKEKTVIKLKAPTSLKLPKKPTNLSLNKGTKTKQLKNIQHKIYSLMEWNT